MKDRFAAQPSPHSDLSKPPEIQRLSRQASDDLEKAADRSFRRGLVLIAALLTGAVLGGLVYRFLAEKLKQRAAPGGG